MRSTAVSILIPVYNDWIPLSVLLSRLDTVFRDIDIELDVVLVDDGSQEPLRKGQLSSDLKKISRIRVIELKRNLGHQRAIAIGLVQLAKEAECDVAIVMDADGEDRPEDALRLLEAGSEDEFRSMIFAQRSKRSEGLPFTLFYAIYKALYRLLTGTRIRFGNFSVVPRPVIDRLVVVSETWNHYAGGAIVSRMPFIEIPADRGPRISGSSSMNLPSLIIHGLSAISVFGDRVGVRLLLGSISLMILSIIGIITIVLIRFMTDLAIPGWATYAVASLFIILMQGLSLSIFFIFIVLSNRGGANFLPERDGIHFISIVRTVFEGDNGV